jgi:uncharacterized protein YkwD
MKIKFILLLIIIFIQSIFSRDFNDVIPLNQGVTNYKFATKLELEVVNELNRARTNPKKYAEYLKEYRKYYKRRMYLKKPGRVSIKTNEGVSAVDVAIKYLESKKAIMPLKLSKGMTLAARDQVTYQGARGLVGHNGVNNSSPFDRINKYGKWNITAGENINYGNDIPREIVIDLIIDDGIKNRGHRENIFNEKFLVVGVACGTHEKYKYMCVMDFAGEYQEK